MNCIALIALLGAMAHDVTSQMSPDATPYASWGDVGVDGEDRASFDSYGGFTQFDDVGSGVAPEPQTSYIAPLPIRDSSYDNGASFVQELYGAGGRYWPNQDVNTYGQRYDEGDAYQRSFDYITRGPQGEHRDFSGRRPYDSPAYLYAAYKNYLNGLNRHRNAYSIGPLHPERKYHHSDYFINEPYSRVEMQPSPVYAGI